MFLLPLFEWGFGEREIRNILLLSKKILYYMADFSHTRRAHASHASRKKEGTRRRLAPYKSGLRCGLEVLEVAEGRLAAGSLSNWKIIGYKSTTAVHF